MKAKLRILNPDFLELFMNQNQPFPEDGSLPLFGSSAGISVRKVPTILNSARTTMKNN